MENLSRGASVASGILFPAAHLDPKILRLDTVLEKSIRPDILEGWDWILIRESLKTNKNLSMSQKSSVVVTTGGSDPHGVAIKLWNLFLENKIRGRFLIGENFSFPDWHFKSSKIVDKAPYNEKDLKSSDIVISTFGVSVYESLYLGKVLLSIGHSRENAIGSEILASRSEAVLDLGYYEDLTAASLMESIRKARKLCQERVTESRIDGAGAMRVVSWLCADV